MYIQHFNVHRIEKHLQCKKSLGLAGKNTKNHGNKKSDESITPIHFPNFSQLLVIRAAERSLGCPIRNHFECDTLANNWRNNFQMEMKDFSDVQRGDAALVGGESKRIFKPRKFVMVVQQPGHFRRDCPKAKEGTITQGRDLLERKTRNLSLKEAVHLQYQKDGSQDGKSMAGRFWRIQSYDLGQGYVDCMTIYKEFWGSWERWLRWWTDCGSTQLVLELCTLGCVSC